MPNGNAGTFARAEYINLTLDQLYEDYNGRVSRAALARLLVQMKREKVYRSEYYQIAVDKDTPHGFPGMIVWHISIKRVDKEPIMDWRDLQDIKNKIVGPEYEAIQLFPAESRCVDSANQYHLYAFMRLGGNKRAPPRIPVGWTTQFKTDAQLINGKQRTF